MPKFRSLTLLLPVLDGSQTRDRPLNRDELPRPGRDLALDSRPCKEFVQSSEVGESFGRVGLRHVQVVEAELFEKLGERNRSAEYTMSDIGVEEKPAGGWADALNVATKDCQKALRWHVPRLHPPLVSGKETTPTNSRSTWVGPRGMAQHHAESVNLIGVLGEDGLVARVIQSLQVLDKSTDVHGQRPIKADKPLLGLAFRLGEIDFQDGVDRKLECLCGHELSLVLGGHGYGSRQQRHGELDDLGQFLALGLFEILVFSFSAVRLSWFAFSFSSLLLLTLFFFFLVILSLGHSLIRDSQAVLEQGLVFDVQLEVVGPEHNFGAAGAKIGPNGEDL